MLLREILAPTSDAPRFVTSVNPNTPPTAASAQVHHRSTAKPHMTNPNVNLSVNDTSLQLESQLKLTRSNLGLTRPLVKQCSGGWHRHRRHRPQRGGGGGG